MKPENLLYSDGQVKIHLIDFGLSKRYISPNTGKHIPLAQKQGCVGTIRYLS